MPRNGLSTLEWQHRAHVSGWVHVEQQAHQQMWRIFKEKSEPNMAALRDQANASPIILWQNGKPWSRKEICSAYYPCGFSPEKNLNIEKFSHNSRSSH